MNTKLMFEINGQKIRRTDSIVVAADSMNYIEACFTFDESWAGYAKSAVFEKGAKSVKMILDENDSCYVPHEVLLSGWMSVSVHGVKSVDDVMLGLMEFRATTDTVDVEVLRSGPVQAGNASKPALSEIEQLQGLVQTAVDAAEGVRKDADEGKFDGKAGTVTVGTVNTVEPDQPAEITNTGDASHAILNFNIPQGKQGKDGESLYTVATKKELDTVCRKANSATARVIWVGNKASITITTDNSATPVEVIPGGIYTITFEVGTTITYMSITELSRIEMTLNPDQEDMVSNLAPTIYKFHKVTSYQDILNLRSILGDEFIAVNVGEDFTVPYYNGIQTILAPFYKGKVNRVKFTNDSITALEWRADIELDDVGYFVGYTIFNGEDYEEHNVVVLNGGGEGANTEGGKDGFSPTIATSKNGKVTTITITDKDGIKTTTIKDGEDGHTPEKSVDYFTPAEIDDIVGDAAKVAAGLVNVPVKVSQLTNDAEYISTETDPTVPAWAKNPKKPTYDASEVGARPDTWTPSASEVGADSKGTANSKVNSHNTNTSAHNDIRLLITELTERLNALADSDDTTLDQMSEIVTYIKSNKSLIDAITLTKVDVTSIVNNLTTNSADRVLSAAQGVALKKLIDAIVVPTMLSELTGDASHRTVTDTEKSTWNNKSDFSGKYADLSGKPTIPTVPTNISAFTNDKGYLTSYTETDPTVPSWAKASSKPSYTKSEVGLGNVENVKQYSASNPPPYPITSVNGKTGAVTITVPTKTSELTNNSGFLTSHQDISGKADKSSAETWTFTLKSGSTVTKKVVLA